MPDPSTTGNINTNMLLTAKGHLAAAAYQIRMELSTTSKIFPILTTGWYMSLQNCSFPGWGMDPPPNIWFFGFTQGHILNSISIGSAIYAELMATSDRETDHKTSVTTDNIYAL